MGPVPAGAFVAVQAYSSGTAVQHRSDVHVCAVYCAVDRAEPSPKLICLALGMLQRAPATALRSQWALMMGRTPAAAAAAARAKSLRRRLAVARSTPLTVTVTLMLAGTPRHSAMSPLSTMHDSLFGGCGQCSARSGTVHPTEPSSTDMETALSACSCTAVVAIVADS